VTLLERFQSTAADVLVAEPLWRANAFKMPVMEWEADFPALSRALRALTHDQVETLKIEPELALQWLRRLEPNVRWPSTEDTRMDVRNEIARPDAFRLRDIPGRKLEQIEAFISAAEISDGTVLEWCSGKSHLGRYLCLQQPAVAVNALEKDALLCAAANHMAQREQLPIHSHCCDVHSTHAQNLAAGSTHVVALHACGDLHLRLLELAVEQGIAHILVAPCCYHLSKRLPWTGMSAPMKALEISLSADDLRTAVQETVTAPAHARRARASLQQWQLGWDMLRRTLTGIDAWQPIPRVERCDTFESFCRKLADIAELTLPATTDFAQFERIGCQRHAEVDALDIVRHSFRRPLERMLVLDRGLWLEEQGYKTQVGVFCDRRVTPRNLLINAVLS